MTKDEALDLIQATDGGMETNDQRIHLDVVELGMRAAFDLYHLDDVVFGWFL